ncbi:ABC transporter ATP-binding protein [Kaistia dalseonensis]|uniref:Simple sugar transport system ATP-binding protein n=1 Tax=Kaistia dalseonensis TaxID=410840 RepID=A0ABU0HAF7_9HYPH|nr:ABC transporter ATP-binding protein [Kaistia dalseonensis]MCX5496674.1 ABC transporter ATP-binding protein [Kaistia dalseonensis]MDQ0439299.1 simple sugar transport system ATP-binding protein [Kaistia dalseonensis]
MATVELEAIGIVKRYGPLVANDHIDLSVLRGEVHAVMGENGAGKSTLMSILYGMQPPDEGSIILRGAEMHYRSALDAIGAGMGMVHQAFKLFNSLSVWENVVYGMEPTRAGLIDRKKAAADVAALAARYRLLVDPNAIVGKLSVGVRQRVEILKALYRDARVLILDEPTAVLTPQERDGLFDVIRNLTADDRTILFVTHKLHEVMAITDRVTVLRDGRVVERMVTKETSAREIIRAMTGRAVNLKVEKGPSQPGAVVLAARGLTVGADGGKPVVDHVDLDVRAGEIVGIAGVAGNGQTELIEALTGLRIPDSGTVTLRGKPVTALDVERHRDAGLAYIPEDRATTGTALPASAADNLAMGFQRHAPLSRSGLLDGKAITAHARDLIARFGVKIGSEKLPVKTLSGGNLQKIVVARELSHTAPLLIAEQPTRGVDVGAIEFIHGQLVAERDKGRAVLLVSAELTEIMALADRILVMFDGRILAEVPAAEATEETLGLLMAGRVAEAA